MAADEMDGWVPLLDEIDDDEQCFYSSDNEPTT